MSGDEVADDDLDAQLAEFMAQGKSAARDGNLPRAYAFFRKVTQLDHQNEEAWLWRAGVADEPAETRACLEELLSINPTHERAAEGLRWLREQNPDLFLETEPASPNGAEAERALESLATATATFSLEPPGTEALVASPERGPSPRSGSQGETGVALLRCPRCGKKNFAEDGVCPRCGAALETIATSATSAVEVANTGRQSHMLRTVLLIVLIVAIIAAGALYALSYWNIFSF